MDKSTHFEDEKVGSRDSFETLGAAETATAANLYTTPRPVHARAVDIQLPALNRPETRVPVEFRTLSIHVYDSQRFDATTGQTKLPRSGRNLKFWKKSAPGPSDDDADFFGKLDLHTITPHVLCQRFNVAPEIGLDSEAATKRLQRNGPNTLSQKKSPYWRKLVRYLLGDFCAILWVGTSVCFADSRLVYLFSSSVGSHLAILLRHTTWPWPLLSSSSSSSRLALPLYRIGPHSASWHRSLTWSRIVLPSSGTARPSQYLLPSSLSVMSSYSAMDKRFPPICASLKLAKISNSTRPFSLVRAFLIIPDIRRVG